MRNKGKLIILCFILFLLVFCFIKPIKASEITIWPQKYFAGEEIFYIQGIAASNAEVLIYLKKDEKEIKKWSVFSDDNGEWFLSGKELIEPGNYYLVSQGEDDKDIAKNSSETKKIEVFFNGFVLNSIFVSFKTLTLILFIIFLIGVIIAAYYFHRIKKGRKKLKKEVKEVKESLDYNFEKIRAEIKKRVEMFDSQPGFSKKERELYNNLRETLDFSEKSIRKEVEDVEKEIR